METVSFNLITIGIVILILTVYRYLDKNNRSLEKVKKFSDKEQERLAAFIETQTREIQNLSIDLQVNLKTGKEMLKRINDSEAELKEKSDTFESVHKKILEYDTLIDELNRATVTVEENIRKVESEGRFVDGVVKQVKVVESKLAGLETTLPEIRLELTRKCEEEIKLEKQKTFDEMTMRVRGVHQEQLAIEKRLKEHAAFMTKLDTRGQQFEHDYEKKLERHFMDFIVKANEKKGLALADLDAKVQVIKNESASFDALRAEASAAFDKEMAAFRAGCMETSVTLKKEITAAESDFSQMIERIRREGKTLEQETFEGCQKNILKSADDTRLMFEDKLFKLKEEISLHQNSFTEELDGLSRFREELKTTVKAVRTELGESTDVMKIGVEQLKKDIVREIDEASSEIEAKSMKNIEGKLLEFENDINYRLKKIENMNVDIERLDENMKILMEVKKNEIKDQLSTIAQELEEKALSAKSDHGRILDEMSGTLAALDAEVSGLKSRAYQDVSEKLKVFEDEFFADLGHRNDKIDAELSKWEQGITVNVEKRMAELEKSVDEKYARYEEGLVGLVNSKLSLVSDKISSVRDQFDGYYENLHRELDAISKKQVDVIARNQMLDRASSFITGLEQQLTTIRKDMDDMAPRLKRMHHLEEEFGRVEAKADDLSKKMYELYDTTGAKLDRMTNDIESKKSEISERMNDLNAEVEEYRDNLVTKIDSYASVIGDKVEAAKKSADNAIGDIKKQFERERDELVASTDARRSTIQSELAEIGNKLLVLSGGIDERTKASLENFNIDLEKVESEYVERVREFQRSADEKIAVFSKTLRDDQDKMKLLSERWFERVETQYKTLLANLGELDKQQKNFEGQTKLFERADKLRFELKGYIDELKTDLAALEPEQKKMKEVETELARVQKASSEVSAKLARFFAEKNRIDDLETDIRQLMKVSESVERKLENVTASNDALQEIELKLKSLYDLEQKTESQFERLEKKNHFIEVTTREVEKNFKLLDDLEKHVLRIDQNVQSFPPKLMTINDQIKTLADNKEKADAAIEQLGKVNDLLTDLDERTMKLQVAREWLSKTETRLETIAKSAGEQLNLLKALLKDTGGANGKTAKGAPSYDTRQMIVKLARQGWSMKEISKATGVSQGEVELILELEPQKR